MICNCILWPSAGPGFKKLVSIGAPARPNAQAVQDDMNSRRLNCLGQPGMDFLSGFIFKKYFVLKKIAGII
jgi:hypothetical protein